MKFDTLSIQNFGSIKTLEFPLADQGLVLIAGRNEDAPKADSNGAGKSLPLDAFTWVLWGDTVRGFSTEEVVHKKVGKDCAVSLSFSDKGESYKVRRLRRNSKDKKHKPNDLLLFHNGEEVSGASIAATQAQIDELLGLDFTTFCAMMPGAGITVATMTDSQVKALLEKLLRTEVLSSASEVARKRYKVCTEELLVYRTQLRDLDVALEDIKERISSLKNKESTYLEEQRLAMEGLESKITALKEQQEKLNEVLLAEAEVLSAIESKKASICSLEVKLHKFQVASRDLRIKYEGKLSKTNTDITIAQSKHQTFVDSRAEIEAGDGVCPMCTQKVDAVHKVKIVYREEVQRRIEEILKKDSAAMTAVYLHAANALAQDEAEEEFFIGKEKDSLEVFNILKKEIDAARLSYDSLESQLQLLEDTKKISSNRENPYMGLFSEEVLLYAAKSEEKEELLESLALKEERSSILDFWVNSFSPSGIRSYMLEHVTPILNQYAKKYADMMTEGEMEVTFHTKDTLKTGKSKERFNIKVEQKHGGGSYSSNSSGERARANLIIALSLGDLASLRAAKSLPFRFLDEPFESIDALGTEAIVAFLNEQKDQYNTVYVITHQDSLQQMFQKKLTIVKKDGYSVMEKE